MQTARLAALTILAAVHPAWGQAPSFRLLPSLPGYARGSNAEGISADGSLIVGASWTLASVPGGEMAEATCWTAGVPHGLGTRPDLYSGSSATAVSDDGRVITGALSGPATIGCIWRDGIRTDGAQGAGLPFVLSADGARALGPFLAIPDDFALASRLRLPVDIAGDGSAISGQFCINGTTFFTCVPVGGVMLADGSILIPPCQDAGLLSQDARIVASASCWWDRQRGVVVPVNPGAGWEARGLSSAGRVLVGSTVPRTPTALQARPRTEAFSYGWIWTEATGYRRLECVMAQLGVPLDGCRLLTAAGVSADGTIIVGTALDAAGAQHAYMATIPQLPPSPDFNRDGALDPDDLSDFITCFFTQVQDLGPCAQADFNANGAVDPDDLSDYITAFFTGC